MAKSIGVHVNIHQALTTSFAFHKQLKVFPLAADNLRHALQPHRCYSLVHILLIHRQCWSGYAASCKWYAWTGSLRDSLLTLAAHGL